MTMRETHRETHRETNRETHRETHKGGSQTSRTTAKGSQKTTRGGPEHVEHKVSLLVVLLSHQFYRLSRQQALWSRCGHLKRARFTP